jgi:hypothetical protein
MTNDQRIVKVRAAYADLGAALARAIKSGEMSDWAAVETLGATIHRQSRLLAGKPRGG